MIEFVISRLPPYAYTASPLVAPFCINTHWSIVTLPCAYTAPPFLAAVFSLKVELVIVNVT